MQADGVYYFETEVPGDESVVGWGSVRSTPYKNEGIISYTEQELGDTCLVTGSDLIPVLSFMFQQVAKTVHGKNQSCT